MIHALFKDRFEVFERTSKVYGGPLSTISFGLNFVQPIRFSAAVSASSGVSIGFAGDVEEWLYFADETSRVGTREFNSLRTVSVRPVGTTGTIEIRAVDAGGQPVEFSESKGIFRGRVDLKKYRTIRTPIGDIIKIDGEIACQKDPEVKPHDIVEFNSISYIVEYSMKAEGIAGVSHQELGIRRIGQAD